MIISIICPKEIALNSGKVQPKEFRKDLILDTWCNKSKESEETWLITQKNW